MGPYTSHVKQRAITTYLRAVPSLTNEWDVVVDTADIIDIQDLRELPDLFSNEGWTSFAARR